MAQRKKEPALSPAAAGATVLTARLLAFGVCLAVLAGAARQTPKSSSPPVRAVEPAADGLRAG
ncbi:MAG: hypothetical protein LUF86_04765 [Clostridiales bacterium]|nr:hypothetical protein [Clostridiales bacterium]